MINMEQVLYDRVKAIMDTWEEPDIYAVSFFLRDALVGEPLDGIYSQIPEFLINFNRESNCAGAGPNSPERWRYGYWRRIGVPIIDPYSPTAETKLLLQWYQEQGFDLSQQDDDMYPAGYPELMRLAANVARRLQLEGYLKKKLGKAIPIIVHDLGYSSDCLEATITANPHGEADTFLAMQWREEDDEEDPQVESFGRMVGGMMGRLWQQLNRLGLEEEPPQEEGDLLSGLLSAFLDDDSEDEDDPETEEGPQ